MNKNRKNILIIVLLLGLSIISYYSIFKILKKVSSYLQNATANTHSIKIDGKEIIIELANTPEKRKKGLSGKNKLEEGLGMLFDFGVEDTYPTFWMKDMNFPIDIIWINNGRVIGIDKNVQVETGKSESELTLYSPSQSIDYVLEVTAGFSEKNTIMVGDRVDLSEI